MNRRWMLVMLALPLALAGCAHRPQPQYYYAPPAPSYSPIAQQGLHDGFEAARHDIANGKPPSVETHARFRNPPVPPPAWGEYRRAFSDGYANAMQPAPSRGMY